MKKTASILKFATFILGLMFSAMFITSCGDDDVEGCMDADAVNYNAEATIDDGTCEYARDKFLGDYLGSLACPGVLGTLINSDTLPFNISEGVLGINSVLLNLQGGIPVSFGGTVDQNTLTIDATLPDLPIDINGDMVPDAVTLVVGGSATISGNELTGTVSITVTQPIPLPAENCAIMGTKQ